MGCQAITNKGGNLYISTTPVDHDVTPEEILSIASTQVTGVGSISNTGIEQDIDSYAVYDSAFTASFKGDARALTWDIEILDKGSFAQQALDNAARPNNHSIYAAMIVWEDGEIEISTNLIHSPNYIKGVSSGVRLASYSFTPASFPVRVPPTIVSNEDVIVVN